MSLHLHLGHLNDFIVIIITLNIKLLSLYLLLNLHLHLFLFLLLHLFLFLPQLLLQLPLPLRFLQLHLPLISYLVLLYKPIHSIKTPILSHSLLTRLLYHSVYLNVIIYIIDILIHQTTLLLHYFLHIDPDLNRSPDLIPKLNQDLLIPLIQPLLLTHLLNQPQIPLHTIKV